MKILVVDDSQTMRSIIQKDLVAMGYKDLILADSGEKALDILETENPNLILLDWHMGALSGLDCLRSIKHNEKTKNIPVIMLTVEHHARSIQEAVESGADDYMVKPLDKTLFNQKVTDLRTKFNLPE
ncbi:MAG: hypothetical protein A2268_12235 [Candidatus Raymondbacteria bacterium RifOxyA12_full_50_37]|uniref:Response regulatory domain-containing protein n=1 Tax=Candidatus Raymondbacteria bacterium RIFOXYD12_FULL_49_13 TaxID=1817890 RepID=A0A1F7F2M8_UNCRA|nr:MAG: hypothetical protein A2268_12235 [Candidatus Raymondbacteria bacterium RifOxyA12_full_50_37]OGJ90319.1 MAG: hypothetical protein A2248_00120 [Candidatus Raymondbacteria bacterium RIFOXYA2_FULL_49_16]OGJ97309.1 MAG: hypothetical protein A2453_01580 [Candidatus Raymondbacteria bacterium RIFOXYC2_FULL_50_21]OGK00716.1 MAG: hypothetical protein A2487_18470 [Candidatus Raymondbacteria bacterium RifOxyC12_full_50_8]OGK00920.1 MAG: hypothetical protein A2519_12750 [Candidatus Raymondbacteria b